MEKEFKTTTWVMEKPEDVFPEIRKTWTMEVRNNENVCRYTTYTAPHGRVKLIRGEQRNRLGKWRTFQCLRVVPGSDGMHSRAKDSTRSCPGGDEDCQNTGERV